MQTRQATITIKRIEGYNALEMTWACRVDPRDIRDAFQAVHNVLNDTQAPVYVVVDLCNNPQIPLLDTLYAAIEPYRHPLLEEWLVVGTSQVAYLVERSLSRITGRHNVRWFNTCEEALQYIKDATQDFRFE